MVPIQRADVTNLSYDRIKPKNRGRPVRISLFKEIFMRRTIVLLSLTLILVSPNVASAQNNTPHNLMLFVPDGLRARIVTPQTAPAMADVRDKGVNFRNPHSLFPTFTTANASSMATGH